MKFINILRTTMSKVCIKCEELKELTEYYKRKDRGKISYRNDCKKCIKINVMLTVEL